MPLRARIGRTAPYDILCREDIVEHLHFLDNQKDHREPVAMAVEVVAAGGGAEHSRVPVVRAQGHGHNGQAALLARHGVPDGEAAAVPPVEEDAAVASVNHAPAAEVGAS